MNAEHTLLSFAVTATVAWLCWHYGWRPLALDELRQTLFTIRDQLFLDAAQGRHGLSFDLPAYRAVRQQINGLLRFCFRITFAGIVIYQVTPLRKRLRDFKTPDQVAIEALPDGEAKDTLGRVRRNVTMQVVKYLLKTSPVLLVICMIAASVTITYCLANRGWQWVRTSWRSLIVERFTGPLQPIEVQAASA